MLLPLLVLAALTFLPVMPWVWAVTRETPGAWARWWAEVTRRGTTAAPNGKWYTYAEVLRLALPWTAWAVAGGVLVVAAWRRGTAGARAMLALLWVGVPILVMSLARDRKPHYLLPMVAPLAVLAARGLDAYWRQFARRPRRPEAVAVLALHWLGLAGMIGGVWLDRRADPNGAWAARRWPELACMAAGLAGVAAGVWLARARRSALVAATVAAVLATRCLEAVRPAHVPEDRAALRAVAAEVWRVGPDADVYIHDTAGGAALAVQAASELQVLVGRVVRWTPNPPPPPPPPRSPAPGGGGERGVRAAIVAVHRAKFPPRAFGGPGWTSVARDGEKVSYELLVPGGPAPAGARAAD